MKNKKMRNKRFIKIVVVILLTTTLLGISRAVHTIDGNQAADLMSKARQYDNNYVSGSQADRQSALNYYKSALAANPDDKQRLDILFQMGRLYSSGYQLEKGEKPDFHKAIACYEKIIKEYPDSLNNFIRAKTLIGSSYLALGQFENFFMSSRRILEFDNTALQGEIDLLEREIHEMERGIAYDSSCTRTRIFDMFNRNPELLDKRQKLQESRKYSKAISKYQEITIDQISYCSKVSNILAHGELRYLADHHPDAKIAEKAYKLLVENLDKMPDLWAPKPLNNFLTEQEQSLIDQDNDVKILLPEGCCPIPSANELNPTLEEQQDKQANVRLSITSLGVVVLCSLIFIGVSLKRLKFKKGGGS